MKTTRYFDEDVRLRRPYLRTEWIEQVLAAPARVERQPNGRLRLWGYVSELGHYLRVVTLEDGEAVHNAFPDRRFKETP